MSKRMRLFLQIWTLSMFVSWVLFAVGLGIILNYFPDLLTKVETFFTLINVFNSFLSPTFVVMLALAVVTGVLAFVLMIIVSRVRIARARAAENRTYAGKEGSWGRGPTL